MKYKTMMARSTVERVINRAWSSSAGKVAVIACTCISYRLHLHIVWDLNLRVKDAYGALAPRSRAGGVAQHKFRIDYHFMIGHRGLAGFGKQRIADQMPDCIARNVHRGERRVTELGKLHVIESGDGDILWDADAALAQFTQSADRHNIVPADDGRRRGCRARAIHAKRRPP